MLIDSCFCIGLTPGEPDNTYKSNPTNFAEAVNYTFGDHFGCLTSNGVFHESFPLQ